MLHMRSAILPSLMFSEDAAVGPMERCQTGKPAPSDVINSTCDNILYKASLYHGTNCILAQLLWNQIHYIWLWCECLVEKKSIYNMTTVN